jgi:transposase
VAWILKRRAGMAKPLVTDELWTIIQPLLPPEPPKPKGGRPRVPDRAALTGIIFVLRTGIPWEYLPREMGGGSGMTCWRRLRDWNKANGWHRLHTVVLDHLGAADQIGWSRVSLDSTSLRAKKGGPKLGPTRLTGARRARKTTSWSTAAARRWRTGRPGPTTMTASSSSR